MLCGATKGSLSLQQCVSPRAGPGTVCLVKAPAIQVEKVGEREERQGERNMGRAAGVPSLGWKWENKEIKMSDYLQVSSFRDEQEDVITDRAEWRRASLKETLAFYGEC